MTQIRDIPQDSRCQDASQVLLVYFGEELHTQKIRRKGVETTDQLLPPETSKIKSKSVTLVNG